MSSLGEGNQSQTRCSCVVTLPFARGGYIVSIQSESRQNRGFRLSRTQVYYSFCIDLSITINIICGKSPMIQGFTEDDLKQTYFLTIIIW